MEIIEHRRSFSKVTVFDIFKVKVNILSKINFIFLIIIYIMNRGNNIFGLGGIKNKNQGNIYDLQRITTYDATIGLGRQRITRKDPELNNTFQFTIVMEGNNVSAGNSPATTTLRTSGMTYLSPFLDIIIIIRSHNIYLVMIDFKSIFTSKIRKMNRTPMNQ